MALDTQSSGSTASATPPPGGADAGAASGLSLPTFNPGDSPYKPLNLPQQEVHKEAPPEQQKQPDNLGATSHAGAAAFLIDNVLKGASHGYAQGQAYAADQYNKKLSATQSLYNDQAAQLYDIAKSGRAGTFSGPPDPKTGKPGFVPSDEFNQVKGRMLVSWQAMMDTVGARIPKPKKGKKSSGTETTGDDPSALAQQAMDHKGDPQGSLAATYQLGLKIGPPVIHQIAGFLTPEYTAKQRQQSETETTQSTTAGVTAGNQLTHEKAVADRDRVMSIPDDKRTAEDKQKLEAAENILTPMAKPSTAAWKEFAAPDGKTRNWYDVSKPETIPQGYSAIAVGAGANRAPKVGWTKVDGKWGSVQIDPETNQNIPGSFNASNVPPSSILSMYPTERSLTGKFVDGNGVLQTYGTTSSSHREIPAGVGESGGTPSESAPHHAAGTPHAGIGTGSGAGAPSGGNTHAVGYVGSVAYKDKQKAADKASTASADMEGQAKQALADSAAVLKDPSNGPAKIGLVSSYLRNVVGAHPTAGGGASVRITNAEWKMALDSAPWLDRAVSHFTGKDGFEVIGGVTLSKDQALQMARSIQQRAVGAKQEAGTLSAAAQAQKDADMKAGGMGGGTVHTPKGHSPETHIFDSAAWKAANPKGDVEAAKAAARAQHYEVR